MPGSPVSVLAVSMDSLLCVIGPVYSEKAANALRSELGADGWQTGAAEVARAVMKRGTVARHLSARQARETINVTRIVKGGDSDAR